MTDKLTEMIARALHKAHYERGCGIALEWETLDKFTQEMWLFSARAASAAILSAPLSDRVAFAERLVPWEPIESAPRDGTWTMIYSGCDREPYRARTSVRQWRKGASENDPFDWYDHLGCRDPNLNATHWRPFPTPPLYAEGE